MGIVNPITQLPYYLPKLTRLTTLAIIINTIVIYKPSPIQMSHETW